MSLAYMDSIEHGVLSAAGVGLYDGINGTPTIEVDGAPPYGTRVLECATGGTAANPRIHRLFTAASIIAVGFRWRRLTGGAMGLFQVGNGPRFDLNTSNEIEAYFSTVSTLVTTLDQWYWITALFECDTVNGLLFTWAIDGVQQESTRAVTDTTATYNEIKFGMIEAQSNRGQQFKDIWVTTGNAADYPMQERKILGYSPNAVGAHNLDAATSVHFFKNDGSETALTNSETTSYSTLDDIPLDSDLQHIILKKATGAATAAATIAAFGAVGTSNGGSITNHTLPAGLAAGSLMVMVVYTREVTDGSINAIAGWTKENIGTERGTGGCMALFHRWWQSGDAAPTVTFTNHTANNTSGDTAISRIMRVEGADPTDPIGAVGTRGNFASAQNIGAISGITLGAYGLGVVFGGKLDDWTNVATLSGDGLTWSEQFENPSTTGADAGLVIDSAPAGAGGATITSKTFTVTGGTSQPSAGIMFEIKPAPSLTQPTNTWYAEYAFADSGESTAPIAVRAIIAIRNDSGVTANSVTVKLRANGNETNIFTGDIASATTIYKSVILETAPGGATWTDAIFDGATLRFGYSADADSGLRLESAMLEAAFVIAGATLISASDASGGTSEAAVRDATIPGADASSAASDASTQLATLPGTDTGGSSDSGGLTAAESGADASAGVAETSVLQQAKAGTDATGAGSDTATELAALAGADVNAGVSETSARSATIPGTDVGSAADLAARAAQSIDASGGSSETGDTTQRQDVLGADSGTGADTAAPSATLPGTDSSSTSESGAPVVALSVTPDSGSISDLAALAAALAGADVDGAEAESGTLLISYSGLDSASAADVGVLTLALIPAQDSGSDSESAEISGVAQFKAGSDAGSGADLAALLAAATGADASGSASDSGSRSATIAGADAGAGVDTAVQIAAMLASDLGGGADVGTIIVFQISVDVGAGGGELGKISLAAVDNAGAVDLAAVTSVGLFGNEAATVSEVADVIVSLTGLDSVVAIEWAAKLLRGIYTAIKTGRVARATTSGRVGDSADGTVATGESGEIE